MAQWFEDDWKMMKAQYYDIGLFTSWYWENIDYWSCLRHLFNFISAYLAIYTIYKLMTPLNRIKELHEVSYDHIFKGKTSPKEKRNLVNATRRRRKIGDQLPPVFPNGWFALLESSDLKIGHTKSVDALGENFAVFRGETGKVYIMDAYCPHLGANMGVGGRVMGDCIECPFHGWTYSGETGSCTHIPYEKKVPAVAKVKCWKSCETNGHIFVWYHAEGEQPSWQIPVIPEINANKWVYRGRTEHFVNAHIQEIPENGADVAHLGQIHLPLILGGSNLQKMWRSNILGQHIWNASWKREEGEENQHKAILHLQHDITLFGCLPLKLFRLKVVAYQIGPGIVHLHLNTMLGKGVFVQTVTPVGELTQRVIHRLSAEPTVIQPYASLVLLGELWHFERDVMAWNHKKFVHRPVMVQKDEQIKKYRMWYKQFYSDNSPTLSFHRDGLEW